MLTQLLRADANAILQAAGILRDGGLVAFPTETVYGLGANALDSRAVAGIYEAKGRPSSNPLIVHVPGTAEAVPLAKAWPAVAQKLAERFWPGPLTLVVPASPRVSELVTAGGTTVALRVPAHPVALALLQATGLPLAAPSANRSSGLSPTLAEHVLASLGGRIPLILDAGAAPGGLESTVVDVTTSPPMLLRPGLVTPAQIEAEIGPIARQLGPTIGQPVKSPGMMSRHYAPRTPMECASGDGWEEVQRWMKKGFRVGWLSLGELPQRLDSASGVMLAMPVDAAAYGKKLYVALHALDAAGVDRIIVALPPAGEEWLAVHDRLRRAAQDQSTME